MREVKRKIGSNESILMGGKAYTPSELSAMLLGYVKSYVNSYLGTDIHRAVISVPAYFNDTQRQETIAAGTAAGFSVERIINEPTAAALSYGLGHIDDESHILVYDLGGGTFDVTLLEMFAGVLEVKASSGDNQLGGKDFDQCLMDSLIQRFYDRYNIRLEKDPAALARVKEAAEQCKIALSSDDEYRVYLPFIAQKDGESLALDETVTCRDFENMIRPFIDRTHHPIDIVLSDSGVRPSEIDHILLVGGSTRIPLIHQDIESYLGKPPCSPVDPDFAVAQGAAIQAGILSGAISGDDSLMMTDVNPYTLGIRALHGFNDNYMSVIIPRNVTIPVTRQNRFFTSFDMQTETIIEVYQGDSPVATRNHFLGSFKLSHIPPGPAGDESIDVEFSYDLNGLLKVSAIISSTGASAGIDIDMTSMPHPEQREDVSGWKESREAGAYRTIIRRAEKALKRISSRKGFENLEQQLDQMIYELKKSLIHDDGQSDEYEDIIQDLLDLINDMQSTAVEDEK
ncbi:molecular chaperone DnaK [Catenibacillus scindens]|uniref:Chaperone protein DnaK n=1 Tax=Catenibacillus scindens TaxID=673271 RepID=A0A7W8HAJ5_9FIRM|nr:molecular chaperone DnaK [Catenibacillus scindens]